MAQASFDFSNTTTVITGGASGIGLTCAELIGRCGGKRAGLGQPSPGQN